MKKYWINADIRSVNGTQLWQVEADSPEEALEAFNNGSGDVVHEEIEVQSLEEVTLDDISEQRE